MPHVMLPHVSRPSSLSAFNASPPPTTSPRPSQSYATQDMVLTGPGVPPPDHRVYSPQPRRTYSMESPGVEDDESQHRVTEVRSNKRARRDDAEHSPHLPRGRLEGLPCVQCAQAGEGSQCGRNRRTIGCRRCNAHRLSCSFRAGTSAAHNRIHATGTHLS